MLMTSFLKCVFFYLNFSFIKVYRTWFIAIQLLSQKTRTKWKDAVGKCEVHFEFTWRIQRQEFYWASVCTYFSLCDRNQLDAVHALAKYLFLFEARRKQKKQRDKKKNFHSHKMWISMEFHCAAHWKVDLRLYLCK